MIILLVISSIMFIMIKEKCLFESFQEYYYPSSTASSVINDLKSKINYCFPHLPDFPIYESNSSFTKDKKVIYLCCKDKNGDYYEYNVLMYVLLHEIAHTQCPEEGHTELFKKIFHNLLLQAQQSGIYVPVEIPKDYCSYE